MKQLFILELRLLTRESAAWVMCALFAAALAYGMWNGAHIAKGQRESAASIVQSTEVFQAQLRDWLVQQDADPKAIAGRGTVAVLPPAPLPLLATGQSDVSPSHESVVIWSLNSPRGTRAELENPSHLLTGRFDLAFVLVWLYPLFLLGLVYDLMAGDRESGTLRLALSQGIAPWRWMGRRAIARASPILLLALAATLMSGLIGDSVDATEGDPSRLLLAIGLVLSYGLFWVALSAAVNAFARSAAGSATFLGAAWVGFVLVAPTLLNVAVEALHPTPSRSELVAVSRNASAEAQKRGGELLDSFYKDHPELAPPGQRGDLYALRLTEQTEIGKVIEPVQQKFDDQLAQQQAAVAQWRFVSPAIAAHEALTDLAGTGYWRHRAFREQVNAFKQTVSDFYSPKIHKQQPLTLQEFDRMPRFVFSEEPASDWMTRVGLGIVGILSATAVLAFWACGNLRAKRLGVMAS